MNVINKWMLSFVDAQMKVFRHKGGLWLAESPQSKSQAQAEFSWKSAFSSWAPKAESWPFLRRTAESYKDELGIKITLSCLLTFKSWLKIGDLNPFWMNLSWCIQSCWFPGSSEEAGIFTPGSWAALRYKPWLLHELLCKIDFFLGKMLNPAYKLPSFNMCFAHSGIL